MNFTEIVQSLITLLNTVPVLPTLADNKQPMLSTVAYSYLDKDGKRVGGTYPLPEILKKTTQSVAAVEAHRVAHFAARTNYTSAFRALSDLDRKKVSTLVRVGRANAGDIKEQFSAPYADFLGVTAEASELVRGLELAHEQEIDLEAPDWSATPVVEPAPEPEPTHDQPVVEEASPAAEPTEPVEPESVQPA